MGLILRGCPSTGRSRAWSAMSTAPSCAPVGFERHGNTCSRVDVLLRTINCYTFRSSTPEVQIHVQVKLAGLAGAGGSGPADRIRVSFSDRLYLPLRCRGHRLPSFPRILGASATRMGVPARPSRAHSATAHELPAGGINGYQPRARHSSRDGRSAPKVESLP